jgi:hypothetical protein
MLRRNRVILGCAAIILAALAGRFAAGWANAAKVSQVTPPDPLHASPGSLDFGEAWASERFDWAITVVNASDSEATLDNLTGDCSCVSIDHLPLTLGPGETGRLPVHLDLTRVCMGRGPEPFAPVPFAVSLRGTIRSGPMNREVVWRLTGGVKPAVLLERRGIDFGRLWNPALPIEKSVMVRTAPGLGAPTIAWADDHDPGATIRLEPTPTSGSHTVVVRLAGCGPPSRYRKMVRVAAGSGVLRFPVEWEVLHEIQPNSPVVEFGSCPVGMVCEQSLTLTSLANRGFRVTRCDGTAGLSADMMTAEMGPSVTVHPSRSRRRIESTSPATSSAN